jgi:L-ribulokinase
VTKYTVGVDFGTESARSVLVDIDTGRIVATATNAYKDGVIDTMLPRGGISLPRDWALQNPADWLVALEMTVREVMTEGKVKPVEVIGLGVAFTACTILPTTREGIPLCDSSGFTDRPHAWPKLWKHHAAQLCADRANAIAVQRREPWLGRYGGKLSSEWLIPKVLQIVEEDPSVFSAASRIVEASDWVVWQLTGTLVRNACAAGYKATWHKVDGFPSAEYLNALHPAMGSLFQDKVGEPVAAPGERAGGLTRAWAERLGLREGTCIAVPTIDAHAAVPGGGVSMPGVMFMIMGTSTCHMLMAPREVTIEGIAGVVEDGIVPGLFGYEAGQAAVGDIFAWFVENGVPQPYSAEAAGSDQSLHDLLAKKAALLRPGQSGLLALDWWNGNRSVLVDANLGGLILGMDLGTRPEEIYRALLEATAYGTRVIIGAFTQQDLDVSRIVAGGSLTKNPLLMQIYADVTGREIAVAGTDQPTALGASIIAAAAAGQQAEGYTSIPEACRHMAPSPSRIYYPDRESKGTYDGLFAEYCRLYDYFGRDCADLMHSLRNMRRVNSPGRALGQP